MMWAPCNLILTLLASLRDKLVSVVRIEPRTPGVSAYVSLSGAMMATMSWSMMGTRFRSLSSASTSWSSLLVIVWKQTSRRALTVTLYVLVIKPISFSQPPSSLNNRRMS